MKQENLVFLISQPRSGSTLLQKVLGGHRRIRTVSEPWLMLNFCYSLKKEGIVSEYDRRTGYDAATKFIEDLPQGGREFYLTQLREFSLRLYASYTGEESNALFLDKTPRYYFILNELLEIFPNAKIIILKRNPLSVLYSLIQSWTKNSWFRLSDFKHDLHEGFVNPESYRHDSRVLFVQYERLVAAPTVELQRICGYLGIPFEEGMLNYGSNEEWPLGDQSQTLQSGGILSDQMDRWKQRDLSSQEWRVLVDYMNWIGEERMNLAGYDFKTIRDALLENRPATDEKSIRDVTFSLESLLENTSLSLYKHQQMATELERIRNSGIINWTALRRKLQRYLSPRL